MKKFILSALFGALTMVAAPAANAFDHTFYAGMFSGLGEGIREGCTTWDRSTTPDDCSDDWDGGPIDIFNYMTGGLVGGQVGVLMTNGPMLFGVEGSAMVSSMSAGIDQFGGTGTMAALGALTGIIGVQMGAFSVYGEAGLGAGLFSYSMNRAGCEFQQSYFGPVVGASAAFNLTDNIQLFTEANAFLFGDSSASCPPTASPRSYSETTATVGVVKLGVNVLLK